MVKQSWFEEPITATGLVEAKSKEPFVGGLLGVITDWDRRKRIFTAQTRMTAVGKRGVLRLNFEAAEECVDKNELRAIDAAPMPVPVSLKAQRSLEARRRRTGHKDQ